MDGYPHNYEQRCEVAKRKTRITELEQALVKEQERTKALEHIVRYALSFYELKDINVVAFELKRDYDEWSNNV